MRRDMEYCVEIMQQISKKEFPREIHLHNHFYSNISDEEIEANNKYFDHLEILQNGGFIFVEAIGVSGGKKLIRDISITWNGHDFLDMTENKGLWEKTKEAAKAKGFEVAKMPLDLLVSLTKLKAKEMLGIEIE